MPGLTAHLEYYKYTYYNIYIKIIQQIAHFIA